MSASKQEWRNFFDSAKAPDNFEVKKQQIKRFVDSHTENGNKVVLVTSGGTTVPLESKTVRFIDNFSVGTRGSVSAESLQPFHRMFSRLSILDIFQTDGSSHLKVKEEMVSKVHQVLDRYEKVTRAGKLLMVEFTTLSDYLHLLKDAAMIVHSMGTQAMIYLAAAVSDFYIPAHEMPEHKIQSSGGALNLSLKLVPKMLTPLVKDWAPQAFVVSFKLETDEEILMSKCQAAITNYNHQVVIGNQLDTRKRRVVLVTMEGSHDITLSGDDLEQGTEIEKYIIEELNKRHNCFIES